MNQQTVVDVIPIDLFTIERSTLEPSTWLVWGHSPDDERHIFDEYDSLDEAEKAYPNAVTVLPIYDDIDCHPDYDAKTDSIVREQSDS